MRRGPSIRYLLLIANVFILLVPLFGLMFLRLWDTHLIRVTEEQLAAEARVLDAAWSAGANPAALLVQAASPTNGAAALLDARGCVIVAVGIAGGCLDDRQEVRAALAGGTATGAGQTEGGVRSWIGFGAAEVEVAVPRLEAGRVTGAVWLSRRSSSPFDALWDHRGTVLFGLLACAAFMAAVMHFFSRVISRPVRAITAVAEATAHGEPPQPFAPQGVVPAEVYALGDALDRMTCELTARTRYIADFAATASHELKTPITGIRGAVELLHESWTDMPPAQRERFLANIDADAERMQRVVTRLLQLARIESGTDAPTPVEVKPFFEGLARRYDGQVRLALAGAPAVIAINPDHLEAAVGNLLDNAVRHGDGQPVELTASARDGRLEVRVRDRGPGISAGNQARIFERFFTTERDHGGTGLGLAIVRAIADMRGGAVHFDTGAEGTTFTLTV